MENFILPAATAIRQVSLRTRRLAQLCNFYESVLGLQLISLTDKVARLSASGQEPAQLILLFDETAPLHNRRQPGLYHVAWLVPSRLDLARALSHFIQIEWSLQGLGDHLVSEAIYLADPDGNGIEVYADRPRETWPIVNGQVQMDTLPVDVPNLLAEVQDGMPAWAGLHPATIIGHIHLQVSSLAAAKSFYNGLLGFDVMQESYTGALFLSAGGYHHHIGLNTWHSHLAAPGLENQTGLASFVIGIPDAKALAALQKNLREAQSPIEEGSAGSFMVRSPDKLLIGVEV